MKTLSKILLILLIAISVYPATFHGQSSSLKKSICCTLSGHTERVCINGIWYIIVYGDDGSIINIYEDDE